MYITEYKIHFNGNMGLALTKEEDHRVPNDYKYINKPTLAAELMEIIFDASDLPEEHVWLIAMNTKAKPIGLFEVSHGTSDLTLCCIRDVFKRLLLVNANQFIVCHNHPSGDCEASNIDKMLVEKLNEAAKFMQIELVDFVICGDHMYRSFLEEGLLNVT